MAENLLEELDIEAVSKVVPCCFVITEAAPSYRFLHANDLFCESFGYASLDDLLASCGGSALGIVDPNDVPAIIEQAAARTPGSVTEMTFRIRNADGVFNFIRQRSRHITLSDGSEVVFASVFNVDNYEHRARRDEMRLRAALANVHTAVWEYSFSERRSTYTPESVRDFDIPLVMENVPQSLIDSGRVSEGSKEALLKSYEAVRNGAPSARVEICVMNNGKPQWLDHCLTTIFENGVPVSAMGTAVDITREKELLLKNEEEIARRTSIESTMRGKGYYDLTADRIIEYDTSRLVSSPLQVLEHYTEVTDAVAAQIPDERERSEFVKLYRRQNLLDSFAAGQTTFSFEYQRLTPEGTTSWVSTRTLLTRNPEQNHIVAFMYTSDVNDEKIAREVVDAVTVAEYDYIMLVDTKSDAYRLFSHSENLEHLMGASGNDYWSDLRAHLATCMTPENAAHTLAVRTKDNVLKALEHQKSCEYVSSVIEHGADLVKKVTYSRLPTTSQYLLVTCADMTGIMRREVQQKDALESALLSAKQASRAKSEFLSRMSHEIRTPLNAILGMSALAAQGIGNDDEVLDCISKIGISGHYLLNLINDILDMSRIESGKMLLHTAPFNLPEFVGGINTVIYGQAKAKNINFETIVSHGLEDGYIGDAMKLQQVLVNILGNAVKFTPEGGTITFSISSAVHPGKEAWLRFAVNDTGCGISEEAQERIFDAFEQQDNTTTSVYGGSGLGLAIAKSFVGLMGGKIAVRSIVDVGTEFTVEVPLEVDPSMAVKHAPAAYSFADLRTLIVDDDLMVCEQTSCILRDIGMVPEWVTSGMDAIDRVRECWARGERFDFVLVDWKMPDMDGIETSRQIRRIVGPDVTIIIISAYDWASIESEAKAAGVNLCISKPMFRSTLVSAFSKATGHAERVRVEAEGAVFDFTGKRVLLAEDNALNAEIAERLLQKKNCAIEHVPNGLKALERFTTTPAGYFNAILMDVRMPLMDGLQATSNIRHWDKEDAKTIPIIAMTANAFDEDVDRSKEAGMDAHLAKPIDPELMYRVLDRLMG